MVIVLAIVHFGLAAWFASITPYRTPGALRAQRNGLAQDVGAPDERQHVNYVAHIAQGDGFPVFRPNDPNLYESYQSHQPPAFYLLATGWATVTGIGEFESIGSGFRLRLLNGVIGAGTVVGTFFIGLWGFRRPEVGLVAAAFVALLPMNAALSGAVSNDPLLICLCTWVLALIARCAQDGWTMARAATIALLAALAMLTKTTALSLLPIILLAAAVLGPKRPSIAQAAVAAAMVILLPVPWWIRNTQLYGDPFALKAFNQAFVGSAQAEPFITGFGLVGYLVNWVGWWTVRSFFGAFGYMDIWLNETGLPAGSTPNTLYRLLLAGSALMTIGFFASLKGADRADRRLHVVNGLFLLLIVLLFLRFNLQYFQAQGRYIMPAVAPIAIGLSVGLIHLLRGRWIPAMAIVCIVLGGTTLYAANRLPAEFAIRTFSR